MNIVYLLSIILLITSFILLKKNNDKSNILLSILISVVLFFAYNSFVVFLLSIFDIKAILIIRTIINIIISGIMLFNIIKHKRIQKYYVRVVDVLVLSAIIAFGIFIGNYRFQGNLIFETTDPSVHFYNAEMFYEDSTLSMDMGNDRISYYKSEGFDLFSSYTMLGTVFQLFGNSSSVLHAKIFVAFEIIVYILSGCLLYLTITKKDSKISSNIFLSMLIIFYLFGYPFSNLIFGYHYLGLSILVINTIIYLIHNLCNVKVPNKLVYYLSLALLNFYLFSMYYLFVPIVYGAEGCYIVYNWLILKKKKFKECAFDVIFTLIIPFVIGMFIYFIYPRLIGGSGDGMSAFALEGYIYRNLIGNFLMMIPFVIYSIVDSIMKKKIDVIHFTVPFILLFMLFIFLRVYSGMYATYYYYKFYYLLSFIFVFIIGFEINKDKFNIYSVIAICLFGLSLLQFYGVEGKISDANYLLNPNPSISTINHVLQYNQEVVSIREPIYTDKELNDLDSLISDNNYLIKSNEAVSNLNLLKRLWIISLYNTSVAQDKDRLGSYYEDVDYDQLVDKESEVKYLLTSYTEYEKVDNKYKKKFKEIYHNDTYILYEIIK